MRKLSNELWSEVSEINCLNKSVKFDYNVPPKYGEHAESFLCVEMDGILSRCREYEYTSKMNLTGSMIVQVPKTAAKKRLSWWLRGDKSTKVYENVFSFSDCIPLSEDKNTKFHEKIISITTPLTIQKEDYSIPFSVILPIIGILVLVVLFFMGALCIFKLHNKYNFTKTPSQQHFKTKSKENEEGLFERVERQDQDLTKIYVVFVSDNTKHKDTVIKFASFLQADLGFHVIFDLWDQTRVCQNHVNWMQAKMEEAQKIIVIWSPKASVLFQSHELNNFDMFTPVVRRIQSDLFQGVNEKKHIFAFFDYGIDMPFPEWQRNRRCFKLMEDFEELFYFLIGTERYIPGATIHCKKININTYFSETRGGSSLYIAIHEARAFAQTYDWMEDNDRDDLHPRNERIVPPPEIENAAFITRRISPLPPIPPPNDSRTPEDEFVIINERNSEDAFPIC